MKKKFLTIAGGNDTILVWNCPRAQRRRCAAMLLQQAEQVGFVRETRASCSLTMMGGELCINRTIALASQLKSCKTLYTSGLDEAVLYAHNAEETSITVTLPYTRVKNTILFSGIGFIFSGVAAPLSKNTLARYTEQFRLPAFGQIIAENDMIRPIVYVRQTDSLVAETACGSGSVAYAIISGRRRIRQPTKEYISVAPLGNSQFIVSANVLAKGGETL